MKKEELKLRIQYLTKVLELSSGLGYFNSGQRTCLHQERAALMRCLDALELNDWEPQIPRYVIPQRLNGTCEKVIKDLK